MWHDNVEEGSGFDPICDESGMIGIWKEVEGNEELKSVQCGYWHI
jgi:hypothetical protein